MGLPFPILPQIIYYIVRIILPPRSSWEVHAFQYFLDMIKCISMLCNQRTYIIGKVESDGILSDYEVIMITYKSLPNVFHGENLFYQKCWEHIRLPFKTIDRDNCVELEQEPVSNPHVRIQLQHVPDRLWDSRKYIDINETMDQFYKSISIQHETFIITGPPDHGQPLNHREWDMDLIHQSNFESFHMCIVCLSNKMH